MRGERREDGGDGAVRGERGVVRGEWDREGRWHGAVKGEWGHEGKTEL